MISGRYIMACSFVNWCIGNQKHLWCCSELAKGVSAGDSGRGIPEALTIWECAIE